MPFIVWSDKYSIGIEKIDTQHEKFARLINRLFDAIRKGTENLEIGHILDELIAYARFHFQFEEKLMDQYDHPLISENKKSHSLIIAKLEQFILINNGVNPDIGRESMTFLQQWFINHTQGIDREIAGYINFNKE